MEMDAHADIISRLKALESEVFKENVTHLSGWHDLRLQELQNRVFQLESENQTLRTGVMEQARSIEDLNRQLKTREGDAHRLVDENHKLKQELAEQAKTIEGFKKELRAADDLADTNRGIEQHLRKRIDELVNEMNGLRQAPEVLKRETGGLIQDIAKQRDRLQETLDQVYKERDRLQTELSGARVELHKADQRYQDLEDAAAVVAKERDEAIQERDEAIQERDEARYSRETEKLRADIAVTQRGELQAKLTEAIKERDTALGRLSYIRAVLDNINPEGD